MIYRVFNIIKKKKVIIIGSSWVSLGVYRGILSYNKITKNKDYLYTDSVMHGLLGGLIYLNPCLIPIILYKEMNRLETNIRGLELKSDYYTLL